MGLKKAVMLGRGSPPSQYERQILDRLAEMLPDDYRIWSGLTLFAPLEKAYEIDAVVLGHHGLYVLELQKQLPENELQEVLDRLTRAGHLVTAAMLQQFDAIPSEFVAALQLGGMPAALDVAKTSPWIETLLVVPDDIADVAHSDSYGSRVVKQAELPKILLTGKLPGGGDAPERAPLEETQRLEMARFFDGLRHRVRPGRGNLFQELRVLQFELMADMRAQADVLLVEQAAALWLISLVFVRLLEEKGYVDIRRLAGAGAIEAERTFFEAFPARGPHDYLRFIVEQVPIVSVVEELKRMSPSAEGARSIFEFFRRDEKQSPQWRFEAQGDRVWNELYMLGEDLVKRHAMVQTPAFVGEFLLDRTMKPAMDTFGARGVTVLDPACGTGNLVVAAFDKLCTAGLSPMEALDRVHGVDISPIATMITRMRLHLAYMKRAGITSITTLRELPIHIETEDALLSSESEKQYAVVVCNPPYVTEKDPDLDAHYRRRYRSATGRFSLVAPFVERAFQLAMTDGYVGMIVSNSFCKREFGRTLVEHVLPHYDLTHIIDSSGAYIPGHGTPTLMLFSRNRAPATSTIRVIAGIKGEPISPIKPEKGLVWSTITTHVDETGYEDEYVSVADVSRETMARHPWVLTSRIPQEIVDRLQQEPHTLSASGARIRQGSQSAFDALFVLRPDVPRRLSFEPGVIRPLLQAPWIRDFGVHAEHVALAPYRWEDETALSATGDEQWYKYLWKYRIVLQANAKKWPRKADPWWTWQRWIESADISRCIVCPGISRYNQFALVHERMATAPTVCVIDLPRDSTEEDALVLVGWLNSSTACFWFRQVGATLKEDIRLNGSVLESMPIPARIVSSGPIRDKVVALAKQLDALARSLAEHHAPARVLERWDGSSRDALMDLLGDAQMRDRTVRRKMVCHQEDLDWVVYEALGWTQDPIVPITSSASPDQRPFAWLTDDCPKGLQRPLVETWQKRRRALRADPLLAVLETARYKRSFDDVAGIDADENDVEDSASRARDKKTTIDYWERTAKACEVWMLDRVERVFRDQTPRLLSADELVARLEESAAPGIMASVWGSRRSRVTTLREMLDELLLENALAALVSERYTASGLEKRAAWKAVWELQRREDAGEVVSEIPVPLPFKRNDYQDPVSYRLRGAWDVPMERLLVHRDERSHELCYGWAGWSDEQKAIVFSGMGET